MNTGTKLASFAVVLAGAFGVAAAVGAAVGPIDAGTASSEHGAHSGEESAVRLPRGLATAQEGFRLALDTTTVPAGSPSAFGFQIVADDGAPVTQFASLHERELHLIVLSRDLMNYHHLHPMMDSNGHWSVTLPALGPGSYRVFADFQPTDADNLTLGADLTVPGEFHATQLNEPTATATVDGYTVTMDGTPKVGDAELRFTVQIDGDDVRTEPYLGAAGHLVAIRSGDLAYLHVHPHEGDATSIVTFTGEFPSAGTYRLFFDFSHGGTVRTAAFTVVVAEEH